MDAMSRGIDIAFSVANDTEPMYHNQTVKSLSVVFAHILKISDFRKKTSHYLAITITLYLEISRVCGVWNDLFIVLHNVIMAQLQQRSWQSSHKK